MGFGTSNLSNSIDTENKDGVGVNAHCQYFIFTLNIVGFPTLSSFQANQTDFNTGSSAIVKT